MIGQNTCSGSYFTSEEQIADALITIAGYNGTPYIASADGEVEVECVGFVSWDDATVISSLKDEVGTNQIDTLLNLGSVAIPSGKLVGFGFLAHKITLSEGGGIYLRATPFTVL
jgi:hypothetical protein